MARRLILAIAIALLCCSPFCFTTPSAADPALGGPPANAEQRFALVIGNAAYRDAPLRNPGNDATAMAATLKRLDFEVVLLTDASLRQMQQTILAFGEKLKTGGVGLFYYAGHGVQLKGQNYLVPVDADISSEATVRIAALPVDLVTEQMGDAANRVNIVILDACRNNPFERRLRGGGRGLAAMDAARGTLIAYATAPGSVAMDGDGANGLYTGELLKALGEPDLKAEEVFKRVRANVEARSGRRQTPWESSSLTGDFVFNLTIHVPPPVVGAGSGFDERQIELAYWNSMKDSVSTAAFRAYLEQYPQGAFATLARLRIEELERRLPQNAMTSATAGATAVPPKAQEPQQQAMAMPKPSAPPIAADAANRKGEEAWARQDYAEALRWYRMAAEQGHADAQFHMGLMYNNGWGVRKNYAEALRWHRKAAGQGHSGAMGSLGALYDEGLGVPKDHAQARFWFQKAADAGEPLAKAWMFFENQKTGQR